MKHAAAIWFSLLLVVAQAFALGTRPAADASAPCCCSGCGCTVEPGNSGAAPPVDATVATGVFSQFVFLPVERVLLEPTRSTHSPFRLPSVSDGAVAGQPIFRLNCALLI